MNDPLDVGGNAGKRQRQQIFVADGGLEASAGVQVHFAKERQAQISKPTTFPSGNRCAPPKSEWTSHQFDAVAFAFGDGFPDVRPMRRASTESAVLPSRSNSASVHGAPFRLFMSDFQTG